MTDERAWFSEMTSRRVTATEIAEMLGVSRRTATNRLNDGLDSDDLIKISRKLGVSPILALVELGKITHDEAFDYMDSDGTLLATASQEQMVSRLAEEILPLSDRIALGAAAKAIADKRDDLEARRRSNAAPSRVAPDDEDVMPENAVADSSPDEDALRAQQEGGDWTDPDNIP